MNKRYKIFFSILIATTLSHNAFCSFYRKYQTIRFDVCNKEQLEVNILVAVKNQLEARQYLRAVKKTYIQENQIADVSEIKVQRLKNIKTNTYCFILQHDEHLTWRAKAFVGSANQLEFRMQAILKQHDIDSK